MNRLPAALCLVALAACDATLGPRDLGSARALWTSAGLHDYSYVYEQTGFFSAVTGHQVRVAVIGDTVRFIRDAVTGDTLPWPASGFPTVNQLFERAAAAAAVTYDARYGYPTRMDFPGPPDGSGSVFASGLEVPGACSLTGAWGWESNFNPGGSYLNLVIAVAGTRISGAGASRSIGPNGVIDSLVVAGSFLPTTPTLQMTLSYRSGRVVTYDATLQCPDMVSGTATEAGQPPYPLVLIRNKTVG